MTDLRFLGDVQLTDYAGGDLMLEATGQGVHATDAVLRVARRLMEGAPLEALSAEEEAALAQMQAAGLVGAGPEPIRPNRPVQTMFDAPFRRLEDIEAGEIVFVGAPADLGATAVPGARFGPGALRAASVDRFRCRIDLETRRMAPWTLPAMGGAVMAGARLSDLGDVPHIIGEPPEAFYARLREAMAAVYASGALPVVLGGDHSITYGAVPPEPVTLLHLDAHTDLAPLVPGHCHHHGNVIRRLLDEGRVGAVHHYGLRDLGGPEMRQAGTAGLSAGDLERPGWAEAVTGQATFLSLDVDVIDPAEVPGTGTPVPGGLSLRQTCQVVALLVSRTRPVGFDIVELCPLRDPSGQSERAVIEVLLVALATWHRVHGTS